MKVTVQGSSGEFPSGSFLGPHCSHPSMCKLILGSCTQPLTSAHPHPPPLHSAPEAPEIRPVSQIAVSEQVFCLGLSVPVCEMGRIIPKISAGIEGEMRSPVCNAQSAAGVPGRCAAWSCPPSPCNCSQGLSLMNPWMSMLSKPWGQRSCFTSDLGL